MKATVKFSTNLFFKDGVKINDKNEEEFSFRIREWLLKEFDRNKYTLHLYPNGNFSIEIYPEVIFIVIGWNDYELNAKVEHWYVSLEKERYQNDEALKHSNQANSRKLFLSICRKIDALLKNESEISEICWEPLINLLDVFKLFTEICPDENLRDIFKPFKLNQ